MSEHKYFFDDELIYRGREAYVRQQNYDGTYNIKLVGSEWCIADVLEKELHRKYFTVRILHPRMWPVVAVVFLRKIFLKNRS